MLGDGCWMLGDDGHYCWVMGVECWVMMVTIVGDGCWMLGDDGHYCWVMKKSNNGHQLFIIKDDAKQKSQLINSHHSISTTQLSQFVNSKLACARQVTSGPFDGSSSR